MCVGGWVDRWVHGGGGGVWVRVTLGHLALRYVRAVSCSRLEAHRLHLAIRI